MLAPTLALAALTATAPAGTVFLAGGHVMQQDADLWKAFIGRASSPTIAVFASARPSLEEARKAYERDDANTWGQRHVLEHYGVRPRFVPIAADNYRQAAHDLAIVKEVEQAGGVWFGGGAQDLHARCLLEDDGRDTPLMAAVRKVYRRGGVVGGTSAGAAVMDRLTYGDGESADYLLANRLVRRPLTAFGKADTPMGDGKTGGYTTGFGFTADIDAAVDTHVDARGRYGRVLVAMGQLGYRFGIALAEDTALAIQGQRGVAYGAGSVVVFDGRKAQIARTGRFTAHGVGVSVLHAHDAYDFTRGEAASVRRPSPGPLPNPPINVLAGDALPVVFGAFQASGASALRCPAPEARLDFTFRHPAGARATTLDVTPIAASLSPDPLPASELKLRMMNYFNAYVKDLETLTNIDSGSGDAEGSKAVTDLLAAQLSALGGQVERLVNDKGTHMIVRFKGRGTKKLLLMAHTDTVFTAGDAAKRPFRMDDRQYAYGPGVGDDKATCVQLTYFMKLLGDLNYDGYGELVMYFDPEEETGSDFGEQIITRLAKQADACLVMDTARPNWGIVAQRKGYATYQIDVKGRSGHAGNAPQHSASATMELAHLMSELYNLASPLPGDPQRFTEEALAKRHTPDRGQYIPANSINVGVVSTPNTKRNVVPDAATAQVEVRCYDMAELKRLDRAIRAIKPKVLGTRIAVQGQIVIGPEQKTPKVQHLIDTYKRVVKQTYGIAVTEWLAGGISDGNVAAQYTPTIDALGVEVHDEHTPREWVDLTTVTPRTVALAKFVQALCEP